MASKRIFEFRNTGDPHLQDSSDIQAGCRPSGRQVLAAANPYAAMGCRSPVIHTLKG
jgi:hypothetical protein